MWSTPTDRERAQQAADAERRAREVARTLSMTLAERIGRWRDEEAGDETEHIADLLWEAERALARVQPSDLRTALETLRQSIVVMPSREEWLSGQRTRYVQRDEALGYIDALLSAIPGETRPPVVKGAGVVCGECDFSMLWSEALTGQCPNCRTQFGDTGPAPPHDLVALVRELQHAFDREDELYQRRADGEIVADDELDRAQMSRIAAFQAVRAYPLPAPEAPETLPEHRCGVQGFNGMLGDICPACDARRRES
jgi:hypothetical protein